VGRISRSRCISHVVATASSRILAAFGSRFWSSPLQSYPGQPGGYCPPPSLWGSPPGGQELTPFGSPSLETTPLWPTTSTSPMVRRRFMYLLDYFTFLTCLFRIPNTFIYMSFKVAQDHNKAAGRDMTLSMTSSNRRIYVPPVSSAAQPPNSPTDEYMCHLSVQQPSPPPQYIHRWCVIDEYNGIYSSVPCHRQIYSYIHQYWWTSRFKFIEVTFIVRFVGLEGIFIHFDRWINHYFL
jgi:hypothetical protein